jgi:hypothetical protein
MDHVVSLRYKCLMERLLVVSEMKCVHIDTIKEICNAFTMLIRSKYFKHLSEDYPYTTEILELKEALKIPCQNSGEDEWIRFRFHQRTRKN